MQESHHSRRAFLKGLGFLTGAAATGAVAKAALPAIPKIPTDPTPPPPSDLGPSKKWPARPAGATYMGDFAAPKISNIKCVLIGLGQRGSSHTPQMAELSKMGQGVEIVGLCDINKGVTERCADTVEKITGKRPKTYSDGEQAYLTMLKELKPDMAIISSPWRWHARMCIDSMEAGAHAFVEVPMALSIEELWEVINTSEKTRRHCMMMENVNYGREELMFLNMVRQGVIGDLLHGEAAYIHELRFQMLNGDTCGSWRTHHFITRNGNLYPTHGLGPVAQYMDVARGGDTFGRLTAFGSPALGRKQYTQANKEKLTDKSWSEAEFICADISTSIIKTFQGRTILVQWDETSPRPYSRHNLIQGTDGTLAGFPTRVAGTKLGDGNFHRWIQGDQLKDIYAKYEHPLWARVGELAQKMGGHGGMDFVMLYRMVECLRKGEALDQNVYEGALWSAVAELSEKSVAQGGMPQVFPDFTRGDWKKTKPLGIVD